MRLPLTAILAASLGAAGCMEEEAAMFIEGALPLVPDQCEVAAQDSVFLPSGTLDLGRGGGGYTGFLKVRTNLPATFNNQDVQRDQQRAPNFPDYGAVDNNVVIFESAEVTFSFQSDADTIGTLSAAARQVGGANLECAGNECRSPVAEIIPAAGTVFNTQTQLNQPSVVVSEIISGATAQTLKAVYAQAAELDGDLLTERNFLDVPGETQRINLEIVLVGRTTGSQNLRAVRSAPFPFGVDICIGCLAPDAGFCRMFDAVPVAIPEAQACITGQDFATAVCVCVDADPDGADEELPDGVPDAITTPNAQPMVDGDGFPLLPVINDADVCRP
jgi:hypothetical protein